MSKEPFDGSQNAGENETSGLKELSYNQLRWECPISKFKFESTEELEPLENIVGQPRAIEAIKLGAELFSKGYNIFVSGLAGTGRLTTVMKLLKNVANVNPVTYDYCYVNNFENPDQPRLIRIEKGQGKLFSKSMDDGISLLRAKLPKLYEEEHFQSSRKKIIALYQKKQREILDQFDKKIAPYGFIRGQVENAQGIQQPEVFPIVANEAVQIEAVDELAASGKISKKQAGQFKKYYQQFHNEIFDLVRKDMKLMQDLRRDLAESDKKSSQVVLNTVLEEIREKFTHEKVSLYIDEVKRYILDNLQMFFPTDPSAPLPAETDPTKNPDIFSIFSVNVILDNSNTESAPIIIETTPSYSNLFGTIDRIYDNRGFWRTDFTKIKAGSLLRADQGYIIVNAQDLFEEPGVWPALKRVLLYDKLEIQPLESVFSFTQSFLKPEPIDINIKVIIIGGQTLYRMLYLYEKGFKKIFKINAQFDYETKVSDDFINYYARFISKICRDENFAHCSPDGVAAIIEWAIELAGSQDKITLRFSDVADILREAAYYDRSSTKKLINREDVQKAILERKIRNNLLDEKIKEQITEGITLIDTDGERIGQINGLTVYDTGLLSFGKPARITASISAGNAGIINIEREVDMSGAIHNKGVLIISGFLRERFARKRPLSLTASLAFEQSYGGIDGDSASAAEIYVLMSAIAQVPIRQSLAITGSVNQKGDIQPIGGVNEKITGFFEICQERGLTGRQGVIIPVQNVKDLMLDENLIDAVKEGRFHIYSISKIEEGVKLLMGLPAGELIDDVNYTKNTLFAKVNDTLDELHRLAKEDEKKWKKKKSKK